MCEVVSALGEQLGHAIEDVRPPMGRERLVHRARRRVHRAACLVCAGLGHPADDLARVRRAHLFPGAGLDPLAVDEQLALLRGYSHASEYSTSRLPRVPREFRRVGVVGLGTMGAGIAQVCVQAGVETVGRDVSDELNERARGRIDHYLGRGVEKGRLSAEEKEAALSRLTTTTELPDLAGCDLVVEAIVEDLDAKRELFSGLEGIVASDAVLATNTSALSVIEIARAVERPERVVGMHFFNPAPVLPLVEMVRTELADEAAVEAVFAFAKRLGKEPIRCNDTPGFVVNRVLIPLLNDCVRVLDEAGVSPEDLDTAMTRGAGWPLGPCALIDLVGVDVHVHASEAIHEALGEERMAPPERLVHMHEEGLLGRKTGRGFFVYEAS